MYNLKGKVALVTGAGGERGIGRAIALRLAQEGADVAVNDIHAALAPGSSWGGMAQVVGEIEALGRRSVGIVADIGDATQVQAMIDQVIATFGRIDILINNAAARAGRDRVPVVELDEADWDRVQRINAKGTFLCSQAAARAMLADPTSARGGRIINIASTAGKNGSARYAAYCASKFAVVGFTQSLAQELAPHGINVNAVCPSLVVTERIDDIATALAPSNLTPEDQRAALITRASGLSPLGRMAEVNDVSALAAFLASSESDYLTGLAISVAGGGQMH
ncbi:MAG: SDR family NAD(P)-dependent oxidoreductase [Prosthecobacter sp.]|uniref:SDR family NAD(P)-dependent oxidoreductase n=1 Tax=Prosthecobacter sp. TaxID=1965333 RepID=UPI0038FF4770